MKTHTYVYIIFICLAIYSLVMIACEWGVSREFARYFFTDIAHPERLDSALNIPHHLTRESLYRLFGINTTVCMLILWSNAVLYAVIWRITSHPRIRMFAFILMFFYIYLACDDRLQIHEMIGSLLHINDAFVLLFFGIIHVYVLWHWRALWINISYARYCIALSAFCFAIMIGIDAFINSKSFPRLACEDIAKLWACLFLLLFTISLCHTYLTPQSHEHTH